MGPMKVESIASKWYIFVCVDDFSTFTWIDFLREKLDTFDAFRNLSVKLINEKNSNIGKIVRIRSDHGKEFENTIYANFCDKYGIIHEFSAPKTAQKNVAKRKNHTLQEMARVMLNNKKTSKRLWAEAINTACYTMNHVYLRPSTRMTLYEIWRGEKPNVGHFHVFDSMFYILND